MNSLVVRFLGSCFVTLFFLLSMSLAKEAYPSDVQNPYFKFDTANAHLEEVKYAFSGRYINQEDLNQAIKRQETYQESAEDCVTLLQEKLRSIAKILANSEEMSNKQRDDYKYIVQKKEQYNNYLSQCRFFLFKSNDIVTQLKEQLHVLTTESIFNHSLALENLFSPYLYKELATINYLSLMKPIDFTLIKWDFVFYWLLTTSLLGLLIFVGKKYLFNSNSFESRSYISYFQSKKSFATFFLFFIICTLFFALQLYFSIHNLKTKPNILLFVQYFWLVFFALFCADLGGFIVRKHAKLRCFFQEYNLQTFFSRVLLVLLLVLASLLFMRFFLSQKIPYLVSSTISTLFNIFMILVVAWALIPVLSIKSRKEINFFLTLIKLLAISSIALFLLLEITGFHNLYLYLLRALSVTIITLFVAYFFVSKLELFHENFAERKTLFAKKTHSILSVKSHQTLYEVYLIKFSLYGILALVVVYIILLNWWVPANVVDKFEEGIMDGFSFLGITINLSKLIIATLVFSIISLTGRYVSAKITRKHQFRREMQTQVALSSIFSYLSFSVALVIALIIAGFNFTGLAIIVGALSVGIGLGLQNIVNNFISGIILLLEKPIKPGDRIIVGETEGFVNKIRIRSTQIKTLSKEDVIVPNSDLITNQVTNYMFRDKKWRVTCKVGVAYGSDIERVKKVLLEVASSHPDVINGDEDNKTAVLFREFGDSSLNFELWCIVKDVNRKYHIISELNFKIDKAFREHQITIAFPQRDIHIVSDNSN